MKKQSKDILEFESYERYHFQALDLASFISRIEEEYDGQLLKKLVEYKKLASSSTIEASFRRKSTQAIQKEMKIAIPNIIRKDFSCLKLAVFLILVPYEKMLSVVALMKTAFSKLDSEIVMQAQVLIALMDIDAALRFYSQQDPAVEIASDWWEKNYQIHCLRLLDSLFLNLPEDKNQALFYLVDYVSLEKMYDGKKQFRTSLLLWLENNQDFCHGPLHSFKAVENLSRMGFFSEWVVKKTSGDDIELNQILVEGFLGWIDGHEIDDFQYQEYLRSLVYHISIILAESGDSIHEIEKRLLINRSFGWQRDYQKHIAYCQKQSLIIQLGIALVACKYSENLELEEKWLDFLQNLMQKVLYIKQSCILTVHYKNFEGFASYIGLGILHDVKACIKDGKSLEELPSLIKEVIDNTSDYAARIMLMKNAYLNLKPEDQKQLEMNAYWQKLISFVDDQLHALLEFDKVKERCKEYQMYVDELSKLKNNT